MATLLGRMLDEVLKARTAESAHDASKEEGEVKEDVVVEDGKKGEE